MAFTDPIISGEQLNRTGIKSENYIPGVSGWRIATDGSAEFDNLGIRETLWVKDIILRGQDLGSELNKRPKGAIAVVRGYPVVSTTTETQVMSINAQIEYGRLYEAFLDNISLDQGNTKQNEYRLRWEIGTGSTVTNNSPILALTLRMSQFENGIARAIFWGGQTGAVKIRASLASIDGGTARSWCPGIGAALGIFDLGVPPYPDPGQGVIGSGIPPRVLKEWTITANDSRTFHGNGVRRTDSRINDLVAGDWENGRGNQRAWFSFSAADQAKLDELIGVPVEDVLIAEVYLYNLQWRSLTDDGYITLGFHNTSDFFLYANEPPGGIPNAYAPYSSGGGGWFSIKPDDGAPPNFLDSMRDGYLNGFMVGNSGFGQAYCAVFGGYTGGSIPPKLHMKFWK